MKSKNLLIAMAVLLLTTLESCEVVGGIFKAGAATGIIAVVIVIAIILFIVVKAGGKK